MHDSDDVDWPDLPPINDQIRPRAPEPECLVQQLLAIMTHPRHLAELLALIINRSNAGIGHFYRTICGNILPDLENIRLSFDSESE